MIFFTRGRRLGQKLKDAMPLELSVFIKENLKWENKLAEAPYFVKTKLCGGFALLKYDQLKSDFAIPLVREYRWIILDETDGYRPVCVPFFKFGNFGKAMLPRSIGLWPAFKRS